MEKCLKIEGSSRMLSLITILISSVVIVSVAIFYFKATPEQRLKMLPSAGLNDITPSEQKAIERGELKVEPLQKKSKKGILAVIAVFIFNFCSNFYLNQQLTNCELLLGLYSNYWTMIILHLGLLVILIFGLNFIYNGYNKALALGYLPKKNRKSDKYRFLVKASEGEIKKDFATRLVLLLFVLFIVSWQSTTLINSSLKKVEMQDNSKFSFSTYQIASQKLQQQCIAEKEK